MSKTIGKEYTNPIERKRFLEDNADGVEQKGYMKPFTAEELQGHKESLANVDILISEIEEEKKAAMNEFKERLKPLMEKKSAMLENIKKKALYVTEQCYKMVDQDTRITEYYNGEGDLIEARPSTADELQPTIFSINRQLKDGTND